jgi:hypothetical protein
MEAIGVAGRQNDRARDHGHIFAGDGVEAKHASDRTVAVAEKTGSNRLLHSRDICLDHLLAPQVHERHAGIALNIGGDAADLPWARNDLAGIVTAKVGACFFQLRVIDLFDPLAAALRPFLIDQELVVILDQELRRIAGVLFAVAKGPARDHQIAREQRRSALADQPLADDQGLDAPLSQVERGITAGRTSADHCNIGRYDLHFAPSKPGCLRPLCARFPRREAFRAGFFSTWKHPLVE